MVREIYATIKLKRVFVVAKDIFEAFYKKDLAKRLLLGRVVNMESERLMVNKLKAEQGSNYTSKMEGMFRDIEKSVALQKQFEQFEEKPDIKLHVHFLAGPVWPSYRSAPVLLAPVFQRALNVWDRFFRAYQEGEGGSPKRVSWKHAISYVTVRAHFPNGRKELHVSLFQATVLLLFNDDDDLTFEQVMERSGLDKGETLRTLKSLAAGKVKVLRKKDNVFSFRSDFKHKLLRIKINTIQVRESAEESEKVYEAVMKDRSYSLDALIVRIMKTRRSLVHSLLLSELYASLNFPVRPEDIKKRIESLIDREYLERDAENNSIYHYVA